MSSWPRWRKQGMYCWWKKSCTTWLVWNPENHGINYLSTAAGFLPSTVWPRYWEESQCRALKWLHHWWHKNPSIWDVQNQLKSQKDQTQLSCGFENINKYQYHVSLPSQKETLILKGEVCCRIGPKIIYWYGENPFHPSYPFRRPFIGVISLHLQRSQGQAHFVCVSAWIFVWVF